MVARGFTDYENILIPKGPIKIIIFSMYIPDTVDCPWHWTVLQYQSVDNSYHSLSWDNIRKYFKNKSIQQK